MKIIYKVLKFILQAILVIIVSVIFSIFAIAYTVVAYPVRVIIEGILIVKNKEIDSIKAIIINPYYIFKNIYIKNKNQTVKSEFEIFKKIKNVIGIVPAFIYSILLYPINLVLLFFIYILLK